MNTLKSIAVTRRFDPAEFTEFALRDSEKYGLSRDGDEFRITQWFVDKLILDFFDYKLERENMKTLLMFKLEQTRKEVYR